jgi:hypothetical protein
MSFSPVPINSTSTSLDPSKHVNYTLGMVLGVDDFNQDFAYHANRDQWIVRDLIGYGTACGLRVTTDETDVNKGPGINVSPGVAVNPSGQFIRVTPAQCAYLNAWLNSAKISPDVAGHLDATGKTTLYITLCYRDCLTDSVPVPGEACRTEDSGNLLVPSRVQDDFSLDFSFDRVEQTEEDGLRLFVSWLRQVKIAAPGSTLTDVLAALRTAAGQKFASTPDASLSLDADQITDYLRAAFLVWTSEIRPALRGSEADCVTPSTQDCVLLAAVSFVVTGSAQTGWAVNGAVTLDESSRPYLLHLRILQEWLLTASNKPLVPDDSLLKTETSYGQGADPGSSDHYARADHTHGTPAAQVLPAPDDSVFKSEITFGQASAPGGSDHFSRADHTHGTPPDPIPAHKADPAAHNLAGDITGALNTSFVNSLQGQPVKAKKPADGQYLKYVKDHWEPAVVPAGTQGSFVLRPPNATDYQVSAAGVIDVDSKAPAAKMVTAYNGLDVTSFKPGKFGLQIGLKFIDFDPKKNYIVKLTAWPGPDSNPFITWVVSIAPELIVGIGFMPNFDGVVLGRLMVEICEYI